MPVNMQNFGKYTVKADRARLKQVFINLLINTVKCNHQKEKVFVDVSARALGLHIGLIISKHIMEKMDGRIRLCSDLGEGSVFWVELPS